MCVSLDVYVYPLHARSCRDQKRVSMPRAGITGCLPAFPCVQGTEFPLSGGAAALCIQLKTSVTRDRGAGFPTTESRAPHSVLWCLQTHMCEGKIVTLHRPRYLCCARTVSGTCQGVCHTFRAGRHFLNTEIHLNTTGTGNLCSHSGKLDLRSHGVKS